MVLNSTSSRGLALVMAGALIGYVAANCERSRTTLGAPPPADSGIPAALAGQSSSCARDSDRAELLALAESKEASSATATQDSKNRTSW